nr:hypothetical protein BaRGS_011470 [Batillaria attramentaria]
MFKQLLTVPDVPDELMITAGSKLAELQAFRDIPISFSDDEILKCVSALDCDIRSKLILERDRDSNVVDRTK